MKKTKDTLKKIILETLQEVLGEDEKKDKLINSLEGLVGPSGYLYRSKVEDDQGFYETEGIFSPTDEVVYLFRNHIRDSLHPPERKPQSDGKIEIVHEIEGRKTLVIKGPKKIAEYLLEKSQKNDIKGEDRIYLTVIDELIKLALDAPRKSIKKGRNFSFRS